MIMITEPVGSGYREELVLLRSNRYMDGQYTHHCQEQHSDLIHRLFLLGVFLVMNIDAIFTMDATAWAHRRGRRGERLV